MRFPARVARRAPRDRSSLHPWRPHSTVLPYHRAMPNRTSDIDLDIADEHGEPVERDGLETLLPSVARSALSTRHVLDHQVRLDPSGFAGISETPRPDARRPGARTGDVIGGRYVVDGQLGRGGMGRVLRVRHSALGKVFALKLINTAIATHPRVREMFYREARLASALSHDNICSIVDFGQDE